MCRRIWAYAAAHIKHKKSNETYVKQRYTWESAPTRGHLAKGLVWCGCIAFPTHPLLGEGREPAGGLAGVVALRPLCVSAQVWRMYFYVWARDALPVCYIVFLSGGEAEGCLMRTGALIREIPDGSVRLPPSVMARCSRALGWSVSCIRGIWYRLKT